MERAIKQPANPVFNNTHFEVCREGSAHVMSQCFCGSLWRNGSLRGARWWWLTHSIGGSLWREGSLRAVCVGGSLAAVFW